jgi:hypothetical protein
MASRYPGSVHGRAIGDDLRMASEVSSLMSHSYTAIVWLETTLGGISFFGCFPLGKRRGRLCLFEENPKPKAGEWSVRKHSAVCLWLCRRGSMRHPGLPEHGVALAPAVVGENLTVSSIRREILQIEPTSNTVWHDFRAPSGLLT